MFRCAFVIAFLIAAYAFNTAAAAPPVADYGKLPAVEQLRLSPSGDKLAYLAVAGDTRQVIVRKVGGPVLSTISLGVLKPRQLEWLGDDYVLVIASRTVGERDGLTRYAAPWEMAQSTIITATTGQMFNVFHDAQKIAHGTFGYFGHSQSGGKTYGYFGGISLTGGGASFSDFDSGAGYLTHRHADLFQVDLDSGHAVKVGGGSERIDTRWVVNARGEVMAHEEYDDTSGDWRLYADPRGETLIAEAHAPIRETALLGLGRADGTILAESPSDEGHGDWSLVEYDRKAAVSNSRDPPQGVRPFGDETIRDRIHDPATGLLIGGVINDDDPRTVLFDPAHQTTFNAVRRLFAGEQVELVTAASDFKRLVVRTTGAQDSGTYFLVDLITKKAEAIAWDYPTILQADVATSRIVSYKAADGLAMQGVLTLPPGREAKNLPLVVMPHGGPQARDFLGFDFWAQAFASRGYAVFQPNFRGSDGFGRAFRDAGFGEWGRKMQTDISDGVAELTRQGLVAPKRACIVGGSYGGYAALAGVTVQQGLYRCAVSLGGVTDPGAFLNTREAQGERTAEIRYWRRFLGAGSPSDSSLRNISPLKLAARADAPVLLVYGKDDTVVRIGQSLDMASALRGAGRSVDVLELSDEDHWLSRQAGRVQLVTASVAFVEKHNPPN